MSVPPFVLDPPATRVVFGAGTLHRVPDEVGQAGWRRLLFVHSGRDDAAAGAVRDGLAGRLAGEFTAVRPHVPVEVADAAARAAVEVAADAVLCVGGGSVTGTAKAVALRTGLPIVAVPTTYAGSEVTAVWGITADGRKQTGTDPRVRPAVVVYDPELTAGLPAPVAAASGLNAVAHAVEAFWAPARTPVTGLYAAEAVRVLASGLPAVVADGSDPDARSATLFGSYLAG
ncbi:MAG TPA: iron-containing alcohol dehydrogenase, partial [Rugosimonospora sp.]|nr:iron-containing alcohol dehydrogenase [Rugosimonospora sp.]